MWIIEELKILQKARKWLLILLRNNWIYLLKKLLLDNYVVFKFFSQTKYSLRNSFTLLEVFIKFSSKTG